MDLFGEEIIKEEVIAEPIVQAPAEVPLFSSVRNIDFCLGHEKVENDLRQLFAEERPPQSLVFHGPKGIGKATMAFRLAKYLLSGSQSEENLQSDANNLAVRRIVAGAHADLLSVERAYDPVKNTQKKNLDVGEIRKISPFLRMTAAESGWRIVIIDDAETMNRNAQNALLKILEEPPAQALIILVTHRLGALIPTIRSRSWDMGFKALDKQSLEQLLNRADFDIPPSDRGIITALAQGSFGRALNYLERGHLEVLKSTLELLNEYPDIAWPTVHNFSDSLSEEQYQVFSEIILWLIKGLIFAKAREQAAESHLFVHPTLEKLERFLSLEQCLQMSESLQELFEKAEKASLDKKHIVLEAYSLLS